MKAITFSLISCLILCSCVGASKILFVAFISSKSHKLTYLPLAEELGKRGHEVTILTPVKPSSTPLKNVRDLMTIDWDYGKAIEAATGNLFGGDSEENKNIKWNSFYETLGNVCERTYELPVIQELMEEKWDLVIVQALFNECVFGFTYKLGAPLVLFSPVGVGGFQVSKSGGHLPPSFIPHMFLGLGEEMSFFQRMINFGVSVMWEATLNYYVEPKMTGIYREKLGQEIPSASEIIGNASQILSKGHFSLHRPKPLLPNVIEVGGISTGGDRKPLPKDIEDFIGGEGFIYFSMGSILKSSQMPEAKRKMLLNVFSKLKERVIWKWDEESMADLPKNVKVLKWAPQQDLLAHKDIKLFITHCGGGGTEEAIYNAVPLIGFPMFGDQLINAKLAKSHGIIIELDFVKMTKEEFQMALNEVLSNSSYKENAKKISELYRDQPEAPMDRAIFWIEYIIRHKGAPFLQSFGRNLSWFQFHSFDVILTYFSLISFFLYVLYFALRRIGKCFITKNIKEKSN